jgi:predicted DNA binding CopG/RHH family protein
MSEKQKVNAKAAPAKKSQRKKTVRKKTSTKTEVTARKTRSSGPRKKPAVVNDVNESLEPSNIHLEASLSEQSPPLEERFFSYDNGEQSEPASTNEADYAQDKSQSDPNSITVKLSQSLIKKIARQAEEEGISVNDFASELLSEGVVLRAWEILERKNQLRGSSASSQGGHGRSQQNRGSGGRQKGHRGGMSHGRYQAIMDDKATFLEYVRNQERSRR